MSAPLLPFLPLYPHDLFGEQTGLLIGTIVGIAFGFVLERAGFGRARNLAAQFFLTDLRVLKVMFTAIAVAASGIALFSSLGLLDLARLTVPETFLWPQLVGGLLLGVGFIVSGYCPGTGAVAAASGNLDGLVTIAGVMLGSLVFGFTYFPPVERFYKSGAMGVVTPPGLLGVPLAVMAIAVVAMAVGAFVGGEKLERIFAPRAGAPVPPSPVRTKRLVFAGMVAAPLLALVFGVAAPHPRTAAAREPGSIAPLVLARQLVATPERFFVLDLRAGAVPSRIPGAFALPPGDADASVAGTLPATRTLVVYDQGPIARPPSGLAKFGGTVLLLSGGFDAWQRQVLEEPPSSESATPAQIAELRLRGALRSRFTGAKAAPVSVDVRPAAATQPAAPKKGGGC